MSPPGGLLRAARDDTGDADGCYGCCGLLVVAVLIWAGIVFTEIVVLILRGTAAVLVSLLILAVASTATAVLGWLLWQFSGAVRGVLIRDWAGAVPPIPRDGDDPAYPAYLGAPARADLRRLLSACRLRAGEVGTVALMGFFLLHAAVVGLFVGTAWLCTTLLRGVDRASLAFRGIRMVCPFCYERIGYPAYHCANCSRVHSDIRPGRYGVLRRVCHCGARLPTLLLFGSAARLDAACPHCGHALEHRPGRAREFVLPLFGAAGAGKSRLMLGLHSVLEYAARDGRAALAYADGETRVRLRASTAMLVPDRRLNPTPPGRDTRGLVLRFTAGRRTLLLQLYDTAGERFDRVDTTEELTYFGKAYTFLLVIDPLAIAPVWRALTDAERERLAGYRSPAGDPELAYQQTYEQIERQFTLRGSVLKKARIAIVITRGDLLEGTTVEPGRVPTEQWCRDTLGLGNLLQSARNNFGEVEVFLTSVVVDTGGAPAPSLTALLRWVLDKESRHLTGALP